MNKQNLLKDFLHGINVTDDLIDFFINEETEIPDEFDIKTKVDEYQDVQTKLFENKYKDKFVDQDDIDQKFKVLKGTHNAKINKLFKLGMTRKEAESMEFEDMISKAESMLSEKMANAQKNNDAELVEQVKTLQVELAESKDVIETQKTNFETELTNKEKQYNEQLNEIQIDQVFKNEYEKYKFGLDTPLVPVIKDQVKKEVREKFKVFADGRVEGHDGTHAQAFNDKGIYEHVSEPVKFLLEKYNAIAKQQITDADTTQIKSPTGTFVKDNLSDAAKRMLSAARTKD